MGDKELLQILDDYIISHSTTIADLFGQIGISRENYSRWKTGRPISPKMKNRIMVAIMPEIVKKNEFCYLDKCPAAPPPDRQLQIILETWDSLSIQQRGELSSRTLEMNEENKANLKEACSNSSNVKVG